MRCQLGFGGVIPSVSASAASSDEGDAPVTVSIINEQPVVGEQLNVSVKNTSEDDVSYSYIWTIDNQQTDCQDAYYVPTVDDYEQWIEVKVYNDTTLVGSDKIYFSKLPVVYINTEDGEAITSRTEYKAGNMLIQGNAEYEQEYEGGIQIKSRGNQSWYFSKKPYKIKLDASTDLFGFGKNKHWVLLANYRDESLLRNTIANEISTSMGLVGADTTWVDVVLNGEYVGNYQFCEQIRVDESRINIFAWDDEAENVAKAIYNVEKENDLTKDDRDAIEDLLTENYSWVDTGNITYNDVEYNITEYYDYNRDISGGYLLELNAYVASLDGEWDISEFDTSTGMRVVVDMPEYAVTNDNMMNYIKEYMQNYEDAICSVDGYNSKSVHYTQMADFNSMLYYWLSQEICGNNDAGARSRWAYKDIGGLLTFGPVWDFDVAFGTASFGSDVTDAAGWKFTTSSNVHNLFKNWIDDPYFTMKAQEQYWSIRPYLQSIADDNGMIDQYNTYLKESGAANEGVWKWQRGYQGDTDAVKTYLKERLAWLDKQFASQESIIKSLYTANSANPYTKSDDKLAITLDNVAPDTISTNVPADGVISAIDNLACTVAVNDESTKTLAVYVNGLKLNESGYIFDVVDGQCSFEVPADALTQEAGFKNVISLIGKDKEGAVTYTNFVSVVVGDDTKVIVSYDYPSGTPNAALETAPEGCFYPATGGTLAADSTLSASVNGTDKIELTYSGDEYKDGQGANVHVPVMAASKSNPWGGNAYYEVKCSTKECGGVSFTASLGATKKGPRDFKLQYSLDGEKYIDVEDSRKSLTNNKEMQQLYSSFNLPEKCANREILYIRIVTASDVKVNGSEGLIGETGGEVAINHICVRSIETKYTIIYQDYDGSILKIEVVNYGEDGTAPETPVRAGYTFEKWSSSITHITEDITVTAVYKKDAGTATGPSGGGISGGAPNPPGVSNAPSASVSPGETSAPSASVSPDETSAPSASESPSESNAPSASESPSETSAPNASDIPGTSAEPDNTSTPGINTVKKGTIYTVKGVKYKVTSVTSKKKAVTILGVSNKSLKSMKIGSTVKIKGQIFKITALGSKALAKCKKLRTVTIGINVTSIGSQCFLGCSNLRKITVKTKSIGIVGKNAFKGIYIKAVIKVPKGKLKKYKKLMKKKGQASKVKIK